MPFAPRVTRCRCRQRRRRFAHAAPPAHAATPDLSLLAEAGDAAADTLRRPPTRRGHSPLDTSAHYAMFRLAVAAPSADRARDSRCRCRRAAADADALPPPRRAMLFLPAPQFSLTRQMRATAARRKPGQRRQPASMPPRAGCQMPLPAMCRFAFAFRDFAAVRFDAAFRSPAAALSPRRAFELPHAARHASLPPFHAMPRELRFSLR